jgi:hypothetical protein
MVRNNVFSTLSECFTPALSGEIFQGVVPADDSSIHVFDHDADIDGLDNIFAEILQVVILRSLLLERFVEKRILQSDANVIPMDSRSSRSSLVRKSPFWVAKPDVSNDPVLHSAGDEVFNPKISSLKNK